ncbi:hypothetical protein NC652_035698 [Populus alba x Populus x berolinensis]|nr:hypothetical protein NC652_035698 [Populus alba x Populus x berolinensis]
MKRSSQEIGDPCFHQQLHKENMADITSYSIYKSSRKTLFWGSPKPLDRFSANKMTARPVPNAFLIWKWSSREKNKTLLSLLSFLFSLCPPLNHSHERKKPKRRVFSLRSSHFSTQSILDSHPSDETMPGNVTQTRSNHST